MLMLLALCLAISVALATQAPGQKEKGWSHQPVEAVPTILQEEGGWSSGPLPYQCEGGTLCPGGCVPAGRKRRPNPGTGITAGQL